MRLILAVLSALMLLFGTLSPHPAPPMLLRETLTPLPAVVASTPMPLPYPAPSLARATADPRLTARWDSATSATIQWTQQQRGCLYVVHASNERVFIGCYGRWPATMVIELGHGVTDGTARPQSGDVYWIEIGGERWQAALRGRAVLLPVFRA